MPGDVEGQAPGCYSGRATVNGSNLAAPGLVAAVESLGYTVTRAEP